MSESTVESSQGNFTFTFAGFSGRIVSADVSATGPTVDVSHIGLVKWAGSSPTGVRLYRKPPLTDSPEIKIEFLANGSAALPVVGQKNTFTLSSTGSNLMKTEDCSQAMCTAASIKAAVGDLIKGSCTFKLSKD